jgi:hypothetical protein
VDGPGFFQYKTCTKNYSLHPWHIYGHSHNSLLRLHWLKPKWRSWRCQVLHRQALRFWETSSLRSCTPPSKSGLTYTLITSRLPRSAWKSTATWSGLAVRHLVQCIFHRVADHGSPVCSITSYRTIITLQQMKRSEHWDDWNFTASLHLKFLRLGFNYVLGHRRIFFIYTLRYCTWPDWHISHVCLLPISFCFPAHVVDSLRQYLMNSAFSPLKKKGNAEAIGGN